MAGISNARLDAVISERVEKKVEDVISKIHHYATSVATMGVKKPEEARKPFHELASGFNRFNIQSDELLKTLSWVSPTEEPSMDNQRGFENN